jgi:ATP-dependent DNA helicase RecQ
LVSDFTGRLAARLGIPFMTVLDKTRETQPQKHMENSAQQVRNLIGAFSTRHGILAAPVLLIDDIRDSGWTMTITAALLRVGGSGPVYPFALALAATGDS